jgi:hypothetical protein
MQRQAASSVGSVFWKASLLILLAAVAYDGSGRAIAQGDPSTSGAADTGDTPIDRPGRTPFTQYPTEPGAIHFDQMSAAEQQQVMESAEWADVDSGPAVTAAWSSYTRQMAAEAKLTRAAYQSGMTGFENVGVQP